MPEFLAARDAGHVTPGKARSVILLYLLGGAATQDMFDLKPDAPQEVKSQFAPIPTSAAGIQICEHLPRMSRWMHKAALVRSLNHQAGCHNTLPSYTGHEIMLSDITNIDDKHPPSMGSVCEYLRGKSDRRSRELPDYVYMPCYLGWGQNIRRPGPYGGFLGKQHDALTTQCSPTRPPNTPEPVPGKPQAVLGMPELVGAMPAELTIDRLHARHGLLQQIDDRVRSLEAGRQLDGYAKHKRQAYDLMTSSTLKSAFELRKPVTQDWSQCVHRTLFLFESGTLTCIANCNTLAERVSYSLRGKGLQMTKSSHLMVRLDEDSKSCVAKAAELRKVSISDYVRMVTVAQARYEVSQAEHRTIALTPNEQISFWNALNATPTLTKAQRELGRIMRGEK